MTYDAASWGALAVALSILGGILTWYRWRKHGLPSLLRGTAWSLLPIAAWLTGVLELVANISGDVSRWAVHLVFSPVVWLGIILTGVSVVLFGASAFLRDRQLTRAERAGTSEDAVTGGSTRQVPGAPTTGPAKGPKGGKTGKGQPDPALEGMDDIEAILRKHGIQ